MQNDTMTISFQSLQSVNIFGPTIPYFSLYSLLWSKPQIIKTLMLISLSHSLLTQSHIGHFNLSFQAMGSQCPPGQYWVSIKNKGMSERSP